MNLADAPIAHEGFFATHFFHRWPHGKIEGFLCPNSCRESDQARPSLLHQARKNVAHSEFQRWLLRRLRSCAAWLKPQFQAQSPRRGLRFRLR